MAIHQLTIKPNPENKKLNNQISQFNNLVEALNKKDIPKKFEDLFNAKIHDLNSGGINDKLRKKIKNTEVEILKIVGKELQLFTKNHHRNIWFPLGLAAFGIPLGVALGTSTGNMGLLGVGLPIGFSLGLTIGTAKDKKVEKEGRQLDVVIKH